MHTFRFTDSAVIQPNDKFAIRPVVSSGGRPGFFFTDHLSLAFEAGFDHTASKTELCDSWLEKFTIAVQIGAGRELFSRPVLRALVTYAN